MRSFALAAVSGLAWFVQAEFRPDEHVILADCGIGANGDSTSRQIFYYPGSPWDDNVNWVTPEMVSEVPWDGSYPWRTDGVTHQMPNGDVFTIVINPNIPDMDATHMDFAGILSHSYEPSHPLSCYGRHVGGVHRLDDGTDCAAAFICYIDPVPSPLPDPTPAPEPTPDPPSFWLTSLLSMSDETVNVYDSASIQSDLSLMTPQEVFHTAYGALQGDMCESTEYTISDRCKITYECTFTGDEASTKEQGEASAKFLEEAGGPTIAATGRDWTTFSNGWGVPTYYKGYDYPKTGQIVVTSHPSMAEHSKMHYEIICESASPFCDKACGSKAQAVVDLAAASGAAPAVVFGTVSAAACGMFC